MSAISSLVCRTSFSSSVTLSSPPSSLLLHLRTSPYIITKPYYLSLASLTSAMSTTSHLLISSFHRVLTSPPSSLLITCSYHLNIASLIFSAMSTTPHLQISSFHNVSDSSPSFLLITCPYHPNVASFILSFNKTLTQHNNLCQNYVAG